MLGDAFSLARITEARFEAIAEKEKNIKEKANTTLSLPIEEVSPVVKGPLDASEDTLLSLRSKDPNFKIQENAVEYVRALNAAPLKVVFAGLVDEVSSVIEDVFDIDESNMEVMQVRDKFAEFYKIREVWKRVGNVTPWEAEVRRRKKSEVLCPSLRCVESLAVNEQRLKFKGLVLPSVDNFMSVVKDPDPVTRISKLYISDPLHLHPNDTTALTVVSIKLNGTKTYQVWSCAMLLALEGKNKIGFIDGTCKRSNTDEILGKQQDRVNAIVLGWILNSISEELFFGQNDSYMQIRSSILSRVVLPNVRSTYATISSEESYRVAAGSIVGSSQRNQASAFVSNVPNRN
ncbi:ribonuclease H-like domain-containing protein, partial [Tanacetum coccineum]